MKYWAYFLAEAITAGLPSLTARAAIRASFSVRATLVRQALFIWCSGTSAFDAAPAGGGCECQ